MAVMPAFEWALLLHVGKVIVPFDSVMRAIHCARNCRKGKGRNEVVMIVPTPAACEEGP
jgi:hypothetical protein